jgi:hypothetical protein
LTDVYIYIYICAMFELWERSALHMCLARVGR